MSQAINNGFVNHFRKYSKRVHDLAAPLDETQFWSKPYAYGNSFGHLVLHLTGNLNYYIGAQIAQTGYVRYRDLEFTDPNPPSKAEALARFDAAVAMVIATLEKQTDEDWAADYEAVGVAECKTRFDITLQCASHLYHHIGQMIFLQKEWAKQQG
jgi:DinB superfamily